MTDNQRILLRYRLGIVEGLIRAIDHGGRLVDVIRRCDSAEHAEQVLAASPWRFTPTVITNIMNMSYRQLTSDGARLRNEAEQIRHKLNDSAELLAS